MQLLQLHSDQPCVAWSRLCSLCSFRCGYLTGGASGFAASAAVRAVRSGALPFLAFGSAASAAAALPSSRCCARVAVSWRARACRHMARSCTCRRQRARRRLQGPSGVDCTPRRPHCATQPQPQQPRPPPSRRTPSSPSPTRLCRMWLHPPVQPAAWRVFPPRRWRASFPVPARCR